jgi:hypothetical protein
MQERSEKLYIKSTIRIRFYLVLIFCTKDSRKSTLIDKFYAKINVKYIRYIWVYESL